MSTTLVLPSDVAVGLLAAAQREVETAGVLLARPVLTRGGDVRLLARTIRWVPEHAYTRREADALEIIPDGYVPALGEAEQTGCVPIWLHTHPGDGSSPHSSRHDRVVDEQLSDLFRLRSGSQYYGSLIIAHDAHVLRFTGHLEDDSANSMIDRLWV